MPEKKGRRSEEEAVERTSNTLQQLDPPHARRPQRGWPVAPRAHIVGLCRIAPRQRAHSLAWSSLLATAAATLLRWPLCARHCHSGPLCNCCSTPRAGIANCYSHKSCCQSAESFNILLLHTKTLNKIKAVRLMNVFCSTKSNSALRRQCC